MKVTDKYRQEYQPIAYGNLGHNRFPPGGKDVVALCKIADELTHMLEWFALSYPDQADFVNSKLKELLEV